MSQLPWRAAYYLLRGLTLGGLVALTIIITSPLGLKATLCFDCECDCIETFGWCKPGNPGGPWEGTWCQYTDCGGSSCYYTCGLPGCGPPAPWVDEC